MEREHHKETVYCSIRHLTDHHNKKPEPLKQVYLVFSGRRAAEEEFYNKNSEYRFTTYKDAAHYESRHAKERLDVTPLDFCGLETGSMSQKRNSWSRTKVWEGSYLALMFKHVTIMLEAEKGSAKEQTMATWRSVVSHHFHFRHLWCLRTFKSEAATSYVLLGLTKHRISVCRQRGHMCLQTWPLLHCLSCRYTRRSIILLFSLPLAVQGEFVRFPTTRSKKISQVINEQLNKARLDACRLDSSPDVWPDVMGSEPDPESIESQYLTTTNLPSQYLTIFRQFNDFFNQRRPKSDSNLCTPPLPSTPTEAEYMCDLNDLAHRKRGDIVMVVSSLMADVEDESSSLVASAHGEEAEEADARLDGPYGASPPEHSDFHMSSGCQEALKETIPLHTGTQTQMGQRTPQNEEETYWTNNICSTLVHTLKNRPPMPDTLMLNRSIRRELCFRLYKSYEGYPFIKDWEDLAGIVGLSTDAVVLIKAMLMHHQFPESAAEIVLRHWQFSYNKYGVNEKHCPVKCSISTLLELLDHELERADLHELVLTGTL